MHNWPKSDFDIFQIPEAIFQVGALKFDTVGNFTRLLDISDVFFFMEFQYL